MNMRKEWYVLFCNQILCFVFDIFFYIITLINIFTTIPNLTFFASIWIKQDDGVESVETRIIVSVVYSYAVIIEAANSVQQLYHWQDNAAVSNLTFSSNWVRDFLSRANLRRRKITTEDKKFHRQRRL